MLHSIKCFLIACAIVALPVLAQAADKIGVVDSQAVVMNSEVGKRAMTDFQSKAEAKQKEFTRMGEELKKAQEDFAKKAGVMSGDAKQKEQAALDARIRKYLDDQNAASQQLAQEQSRVMEPLYKVFEQVIADYAKKNGFSLIIERRITFYTASGTDVTAEITKEFEAAAKRGK